MMMSKFVSLSQQKIYIVSYIWLASGIKVKACCMHRTSRSFACHHKHLHHRPWWDNRHASRLNVQKYECKDLREEWYV